MSNAEADSLIGISEEYYQISEAVLSSFPKYRLPLDLYHLNERVMQLVLYSKKDARLSNEQVEEIRELCAQGELFVARTDHPIYSEHIVKQLDLVLVDDNLKEGEVADIIFRALEWRLGEFFDQPVKPVYDALFSDLMVVTEYLWSDRHKIRLFMRRLHCGEYSLLKHSINTMVVGLWLLMQSRGEDLARKEFDNHTLGFLLHDVGMSKVPAFITSKTIALKPDERDKINMHVNAGMQIFHKMEIVDDNARFACFEHHERYDGSGYPQKVKGVDLSQAGAICALADSFSAMIQKRPYAEAKSQVDAAKELMLDTVRYDKQFSTTLYTAIFTNAFGNS